MPNDKELYFTPDKPHQKWSVLEDPERPGRRLIYRHYRQPGEKPDVRTSLDSASLAQFWSTMRRRPALSIPKYRSGVRATVSIWP